MVTEIYMKTIIGQLTTITIIITLTNIMLLLILLTSIL